MLAPQSSAADRSRYYRPTLQRFLNEDPIGFVGGLNLYAYGGNAPTNFVDPSGENPLIGCAVGALIGGAWMLAAAAYPEAVAGGAAATAIGRAISSLKDYIKTGQGPWQKVGETVEPATSASKRIRGTGAESIEQA